MPRRILHLNSLNDPRDAVTHHDSDLEDETAEEESDEDEEGVDVRADSTL